ncbi:hypothetical protein MMPV_002477 [Pyropia vietnamensis]
MAAVDVVNMVVLDNPAPFTAPLQFEITYDVREPLAEDLEWKVIYVGSAEDPAHDQELDAVLLPADTPGRFAFVLAVDAPDVTAIPPADVVGVTIVLVTASYHGTEFVRVGYYVNNELVGAEPEAGAGAGGGEGGGSVADVTASGRLTGTAAATDTAVTSGDAVAPSGTAAAVATAGPVDVTKLVRNIAADEPRITKIPHKFDWGGTGPIGAPPVAPSPALAGVGGGNDAGLGAPGSPATAAAAAAGGSEGDPQAVTMAAAEGASTTTAAVVGVDSPPGREGEGRRSGGLPAGAPARNP